jgi:hypothetical protein
VEIRHYQAGDEAEQLAIYNTAAGGLTKFKPASIVDLQRRVRAADFKPATRFYAIEHGKVVGYCTWQANGRVGYPWCQPGYERAAPALFERTLQALKQNGVTRAFAAYRKDWPSVTGFFEKQGFTLAREMVNFVLKFENMPTASTRLNLTITPVTVEDVPAIYALDPSVFRVNDASALKDALWHNRYFTPKSLFVLRNRSDGAPLAVGIFVTDAQYADPAAVDSSMPCFRLGAFGTEGMTTKRIKGLFSFVSKPDHSVFAVGMDMLGHASTLVSDDDEILSYAAQVASDAPALFAFYNQVFERQGSFPVYERALV